MATVSLELFMKHVRADDFIEDEEKLQQYLDAAEQFVCDATNRSIDELLEMGGGKLPIVLQQAVLMRAASFYAYSEDIDSLHLVEVPYTLSALIKPYRKLVD